MSGVITTSFRAAASAQVPKPRLALMPSMAALYSGGRLGAAPVRSLDPITARAVGVHGGGALLVRPDGAPVTGWPHDRDARSAVRAAVRSVSAGAAAVPAVRSVSDRSVAAPARPREVA